MRTQLVTIPTGTIPLDGAFYEPDSGKAAGAALYFHGKTMNFYVCAARFLPPVLTRFGLAFLAFNRRGHDVLSTRMSRVAEGGAFEFVRESIADNRVAAEWLKARGYPAPVVIGHSYGGMLATQHVVDHPQTPALVLLSAGRGGAAAARETGTERLFAMDRFDELHARARELAAAGRGRELLIMPGWWYVISAESFLDRIASVPDTIALAPKIKCPVLTLRGDREDAHRYPVEEFRRAAGGPCRAEVVRDCDHFYNGREGHIADLVASWLGETLGSRKA